MDEKLIIEKWNEILKKTVAENPDLSVTSTEFDEAFCENTSQEEEDYFQWNNHITQKLWDKLCEDEIKKNLKIIQYLMIKCDMYNGKIHNMSWDEIVDTWYPEDHGDIIKLGKSACQAHWRMRNNG